MSTKLVNWIYYGLGAGVYERVLTATSFGRWWRWQRAALEGVQPDERVLEIGCGTGRLLAERLRQGPGVGMDISLPMLRQAHRRLNGAGEGVPIVRADVSGLPFPDASFDVVIATGVLTAIPNPRPALCEARRVLRSGGHLSVVEVMQPRRPTLKSRLAVAALRAARDNFHDLPRLMGECGFEPDATELGRSGTVHLVKGRAV
jgi:ubiquinone/menaquinone biosynthesis C-methylase UbiE